MSAHGILPTLFLAGVAALATASLAHAQTPQDPATPQEQQFDAAPDPGQVVQAPRNVQMPGPVASPYWTANAGFEADTHDSGYGFAGPFYVKPFRPNVAWVAGANINYLYYDYPTPAFGHTNVRSPGFNMMGGVRFGNRNYLQLTAGPGFKRQFIETVDVTDSVIGKSKATRVGVNVGADAAVNPTSHNNIHGMVNYSGEDQYTWARLAYKEQITNRDWQGKFAQFIGGEVIGQGNDDIRSTQVGVLYEIAHAPSSVSVMLRGGYKRSAYDIGPHKTGPWFAIGLWHRLR